MNQGQAAEYREVGRQAGSGTKDVRPHRRFVSCCLTECPLLKRGECISAFTFLSHGCIHGRVRETEGPTPRARSHGSWVKEAVAWAREIPMPSSASARLVQLGDWWWVPYAHAAMCEAVPFKSHSSFITSGLPFVHDSEFSAATIVTLAKFRPCALMGGEIPSYQQYVVPTMLFHVKWLYPELWEQAVALDCGLLERLPTQLTPLTIALSSVPYGAPGGRYRAEKASIAIIDWRDGDELVIDYSEGGWLLGTGLTLKKGEPTRIAARIRAGETKVIVEQDVLAREILASKPWLLQPSDLEAIKKTSQLPRETKP